MNNRRMKIALIAASLTLLSAGALPLSAQEIHTEVQIGDFGAGQVFSTIFQAQRVGDLVLFQDGSVASAQVLNDEIEVEMADGEIVTLLREDLTAIRFNTQDGVLEARFFANNQQPIDGLLLTDLQIDYAIVDSADVELEDLSAIIFKIRPMRVEETQVGENGEEEVVVSETVMLDFSHIFPIMTRMFASMSKFDTAILPDNRLASIQLDNREELEITIDAVNFGRFTFPASEVAWIEFAQEEGGRDVLALQDGDRVSGQIVIESELSGSLALGEGEFSFNEGDLRSTFKQLVFQLPEGLFGGGGGGQGVFISEGEGE